MVRRQQKIKQALDENRMLVLGCQVLLGVQLRSIFEDGFAQLPRLSQYVDLAGAAALSVALGMLLTPSAYHRIVEGGNDTERFGKVLSLVMWPSLLPFVFALAGTFFVAGQKLLGDRAAIVLAVVSGTVGFVMLHVLHWIQRARRRAQIFSRERTMKSGPDGPTKLWDKIDHVLAESRVALPGAQALLGFQFVIILTKPFDQLPESLKLIHLASLSCVALAIVLLLAPAAYHRIVERGEATRHMHAFASAMLISATIPLGLGIASDFYVVARKILDSRLAAGLMTAALALFIFGLWFGFTLWARVRQRRLRAMRTAGEYAS